MMSDAVEKAMLELRAWMFQNIYTDPVAKGQEGKAERLVETLYLYYLKSPEELPAEYRRFINDMGEKTERVVADFVSSMTDHYALGIYNELFLPNPWIVK